MTANTSNAIFMIRFSVRSHYLEFLGAYHNYYIGQLYRLMSLFIVKFSFNITYSFGWKHACFACRALWTLDWCERHFHRLWCFISFYEDFDTSLLFFGNNFFGKTRCIIWYDVIWISFLTTPRLINYWFTLLSQQTWGKKGVS